MRFNLCENINETGFGLQQTIEDICDVLGISRQQLAKMLSTTEEELASINDYDSNNELTDRLYDFAYKVGIRINNIKWQEAVEEYAGTGEIILSHGSRSGIAGEIQVDLNPDNTDFGKGFYCGKGLNQAGMFVADEPDSSMYIYKFSPLDLTSARFNVSTDWLLAVAYYRGTIEEYKDNPRVKEIIDQVESVDYVVAPIADNRMFEVIDSFTSGEITDTQCRYALSATHLGYQYVFKTERCVSHLTELAHCYLCPIERSLYSRQAKEETNTSLYKAHLARKKHGGEGQYIGELLG